MASNWDDLKVFLSVARNDSLSAAGKALKVDPATVGRRIARLEEECGAPLFSKSPQGYALTDPGQRLVRHAEAAEQAILQAQEEVSGDTSALSGQIRIGATDGCAAYLLPQVCADIAARHPDLDIQILSLPRVVNLSKREADMAVAVSPPTSARLTVQKITDYKLHLAAARRYLIDHPAIETLEDLKQHRIIGYIPDLVFDAELDYGSQLGTDRVQLASNSIAVQLNLIRGGAGIGIVHDFLLPWTRGLRTVLPEQVSLTRTYYLVRHAEDRRMDRLNRFAEELTNGMRAEVRRLEEDA